MLKVLPRCPMFMLQFLCKTENAAVDQHSSLVSVCPPKSLTLHTSRESRVLDEVYVLMSEADWHCSSCVYDCVCVCCGGGGAVE